MRLAEARLAASIMIACSMIELFTGRAWLWRMNTSEPRTDSPNRQWISPLANWERLASPSFTSRHSAISSASGRLERPLKSWRRFFVTSSMPVLPSTAVVFAAACSVERTRSQPRSHMAAGRQRGERSDDGARTDFGVLTHRLLDGGALGDSAVGEPHGGAEAGAGSDHGVAVQHGARDEGEVGREAYRWVDVGALGVGHGDAPTHPPVVDALAEHGLGRRQLGPVVDARRLQRVVGDHRHDLVAGVVEHGDDVGQVVLARLVLGAEAAEGRGKEAAPEAVDRGVDLFDRTLIFRGEGVLDDAAHPLVLVVEDALVAARLRQPGRQHCACGVGLAVLAHEGSEGCRAEQGRVAGENDDVAVLGVEVVGKSREGDGGSVACATWHMLLDEVEDELRRRLLLQ